MLRVYFMLMFGLIFINLTSQTTMVNKNLLRCNPVDGACEIPLHSNAADTDKVDPSLKVIYFTDPICSSCWGIEPQLRKLKLEYGNTIDVEYHMGGLLPDWSYNSGGISQPSDVARHWDEVSPHYQMPIDGDVWLEDPLDSSYPPSIAYKSAAIQSEEKAFWFLRALREQVFLQKKNITKWEHIESAANMVGLDAEQLQKDMKGEGKAQFEEDLKLSRQYGVRGFPTLFFQDKEGNRQVVYGAKPYEAYKKAIQNLIPGIKAQSYSKSWGSLFGKYPSLTAKEFSVLSDKSFQETQVMLNELVTAGKLDVFKTKNGDMFYLKQ